MSRSLLRRFPALVSRVILAVLVLAADGSCVVRGQQPDETARLKVSVVNADDSPLPGDDAPMPVELGGPRQFKVSIDALLANGALDGQFEGYVQLSVQPGAISAVRGNDVVGRNVLLRKGHVEGILIDIEGTYGDTRVWAEDLGYMPGDPSKSPKCSDGQDNNGNGLVDFPADPGCAFANDNTEEGGTYAAGVSLPLHFLKPSLAEMQGYQCREGGEPTCDGSPSKTPFSNEQVEVNDGDGCEAGQGPTLIVTRISSDGFYVTDVDTKRPKKSFGRYNHLFAFNFNVPWGMQVCDRLTLLSGTMSEFFGFTELGFPSYRVHQWRFPNPDKPSEPNDGPCLVPEPNGITSALLPKDSDTVTKNIEPWESSLVRVPALPPYRCRENNQCPTGLSCSTENWVCECQDNSQCPTGTCNPTKKVCECQDSNQCGIGRACDPVEKVCVDIVRIASKFGPQKVDSVTLMPDLDRSNCDLNEDGEIDYDTPNNDEMKCSNACAEDPECSEWSSYRSRSNFRLVIGDSKKGVMANVSTKPGFDPYAERGNEVILLRGTIRHFSGGDLNWTIEARCSDDLVYCKPGDSDCVKNAQLKPVSEACVQKRTEYEPDEGTN